MDIIYAEERTENVIRGDDQYAAKCTPPTSPSFPIPKRLGWGVGGDGIGKGYVP